MEPAFFFSTSVLLSAVCCFAQAKKAAFGPDKWNSGE